MLMVAEENRVVQRIDRPNGIRPLAAALQPWLKG